jgi:hypothetical protein
MKQIIDCSTGEIIERELNDDELQQQEIDSALVLAQQVIAQEREAAKQAILEKLGLTEDEAKLILG